MKILQKHIRINGFDHEQLSREGKFAIYEKVKGEYMGFEVIEVQSAARDYTFPNGHTVSKGDESYPSAGNWGRHGWTFAHLDKALTFFWDRVFAVNGKGDE